jgi:hypothetical protein
MDLNYNIINIIFDFLNTDEQYKLSETKLLPIDLVNNALNNKLNDISDNYYLIEQKEYTNFVKNNNYDKCNKCKLIKSKNNMFYCDHCLDNILWEYKKCICDKCYIPDNKYVCANCKNNIIWINCCSNNKPLSLLNINKDNVNSCFPGSCDTCKNMFCNSCNQKNIESDIYNCTDCI